jgi:hypothetical protein
MAICCVSLVLAPLDEVSKTFETSNKGGRSGAKKPSVFYLTGQVVAAYHQVRLRPTHQLAGVARSRSLFVATPPSGFRELPRTGFLKAQLASGPF